MSGEFKQFFNNRENCPYLRLTEIYLIRAEALIEMGELTDAYGIIELLVGRKGNVAPPNTSAAFLRSYVRALWRIEMPREGSRFANLVRWGMAAEVLGPKGYKTYNAALTEIGKASGRERGWQDE